MLLSVLQPRCWFYYYAYYRVWHWVANMAAPLLMWRNMHHRIGVAIIPAGYKPPPRWVYSFRWALYCSPVALWPPILRPLFNALTTGAGVFRSGHLSCW